MRRRAFLVSLLALASDSRAQSAGRTYRIGLLTTAGKRGETPFYVAFEQRLRELGYVEGKNLLVDWRSATEQLDKIPEIARLIARSRCDVVVAPGSEVVLRSIRTAVGSTPIVMIAIDYDPVARNFITGLAKPGGNITGLVFRQLESAAKRLELLAQVMPAARRIAVLWDQFSRDQFEAVEETAKKLKITLLSFQMRGNDYEFARRPDPPRARTALRRGRPSRSAWAPVAGGQCASKGGNSGRFRGVNPHRERGVFAQQRTITRAGQRGRQELHRPPRARDPDPPGVGGEHRQHGRVVQQQQVAEA